MRQLRPGRQSARSGLKRDRYGYSPYRSPIKGASRLTTGSTLPTHEILYHETASLSVTRALAHDNSHYNGNYRGTWFLFARSENARGPSPKSSDRPMARRATDFMGFGASPCACWLSVQVSR